MKRYASSKVAATKAEGMLEPLLESDDDWESDDRDSDVDSSSSSEVETVKLSPMQVLKSFIVYTVLAAGIVASAVAMVASPALLTYIMGGLLIATVPHSIMKERQMGRMPTLRSATNKLREEANYLKEQVDVLDQEVYELKSEIDRLAAVKKKLRAIAEEESYTVDRVVDLVNDHESILAEMKVNLRQRICQDIIRIVIKSDKNNNQVISKGEANLIALRIRLQLHEYGVEFDSNKFLRVIASTSSVTSVIDLARKLLQPKEDDDADEEEDVDLYDMFHVASIDLKAAAAGEKYSPGAKYGNYSDPGGRVSLMS